MNCVHYVCPAWSTLMFLVSGLFSRDDVTFIRMLSSLYLHHIVPDASTCK